MLTASLTALSKRRVRLAILCTAVLSIAPVGFAAGEDAGAPPAIQFNQDIEFLLRMVEQKISTNHTTSPAGESAIDAWKQVIHVIPATDSVRVGNALRAFAIHMRRRADEEKKAGDISVSEDMSVFASQAEGLTSRITVKTNAPQRDARETLSEPPKFEPLAASMPPVVPPDVHMPQEPQMAPSANSATQAANVVPLPTGPPQGTMKPSEAEFYAWRGDLMLAMKDVPAARKYYELATNGGSARAAVQLARINDPAFELQSNAEPKTQHQAQDHSRRRRTHVWRARMPTPPAEAPSDATVPMSGSARP